MVDLKQKIICLDGRAEPIKHFECWFRTPSGLHHLLDLAIADCEKNEWDAKVIFPVSVAVGSTIYEEIGR